MPGNRHAQLCCLEGSTPEEREGLFLFIALRWMQDPGGVMVWLTENIQACLRILRRHSTNGSQETSCINRKGFIRFLSYGHTGLIRPIRGRTEEPILWRTALQAEASRWVLIRGRCPRLLMVVPSRHRSAYGVLSVVE